MLAQELALYAVRISKKFDIDYLEARGEKYTKETFLMKNGVMDGGGFTTSEGIGIRVIVDGSVGFATTENLTKESVETAVENAVKLAKGSLEKAHKVKFSKEKSVKSKWEVKEKKKIFDVDAKEKVSLLKHIDNLAKKAKLRMFQLSLFENEKYFANTEGARIYSRVPRVFLFYSVIVKGKRDVQRMLEYGGSGGWELVDSWNLDKKIPEEINALEKVSGAKKLKSEKMDVVLSPEIVGIAMHESVGHPSEADRIFGREAAQAGESYLDESWKGRVMAEKFVNVVDDPTVKGSYGYYLYDDEGVKARRKFLIKNGKIHEFLHNRETAAVMKIKSNGSSRAELYSREPIIRMSNTFMLPGDHSFDELIEGIKKGVYIKSYNEWNIDDKRWNEKYVGCEAYLIKNGEIVEPVFAPVLEITTGQFFKKIDALGKDLDFVAGVCGKGEPMQGVPVWFGGPHIRLRNVLIK
ncbi:MAG: TldD/PmbA family protein [Candidatus Aenigmarchaeota archaeon]|nr:TldD/PmbA family protein [Candidatus Aenigmarchaeota archaeon]